METVIGILFFCGLCLWLFFEIRSLVKSIKRHKALKKKKSEEKINNNAEKEKDLSE